MSFTTDNNNENLVKDPKLNEETKSPGRRMAEERAERIRYAEEYRRKLEAEKAPVQPKKTKAAEQKEQAKILQLEQEKAEAREKLDAKRLEAERRFAEAAQKLKAISEAMEKAAEAPAPVEPSLVVEEKAAEKAPEAVEPVVSEPEAAVEEKALEDVPEDLVLHIPVQSFSVPCIITRKAPPAPVQPVPEMPVVDVAPAVEPAPVAEPEPVVEPAPAPVVEEPKFRTIDVTNYFRNPEIYKPAITYGVAVTRGGWEDAEEDRKESMSAAYYSRDYIDYDYADYSEEDDDSDDNLQATVAAAAVNVAQNPQVIEEDAPVAQNPAAAVAPVAAAAVVGAAAATAVSDRRRASSIPERPSTNVISKDDLISIHDDRPISQDGVDDSPAPASEPLSYADRGTEGARLVNQKAAFIDDDEDLRKPKKVKKNKKNKKNKDSDKTESSEPQQLYIDDEKGDQAAGTADQAQANQSGAVVASPRINYETGEVDNAYLDSDIESELDYNEQYDRRRIEDEHIRYLSQTKRLDKLKNKISNGKKFDTTIHADFSNPKKVKKAANKSADLIEARMNYDATAASNELAIELLKFSDHSEADKQEHDESRRRIRKIKKSINKARKLERKATLRYYNVLAKEAKSPTPLKKAKRQEKLTSILSKLELMIREREDLDARLLTLYQGAESRNGGKVREQAEKKRYYVAKKVRRKLKRTNDYLEKMDVPESLKSKIRYLLNTKIVSTSTIAYSKYLIKKLKPKEDAKRYLKRDIKRAKNSLVNVEESLSSLMNKAERYDNTRKTGKGFLKVLIILIIIAAVLGVGFFLFKDAILGLFGIA